MMSVVKKINWVKVLILVILVGVAILLPLFFAHAADTLPAGGGSGGGFNDFVSAVGGFLLSFIYAVFVGLGGAVAGAAAIFLNLTIKLSLDSAVYGVDFVSQGWVIARDVANMAFIFILLYIAFTLMLQANTNNTINMLVGVIAVALVINFSFFFTRIVIDAGNILSVQFYNAIVSDSGGESLPVSVFAEVKVPDVTSKIMNGLNFQSALSPESLQKITDTYKDDPGKLTGTFISFMFVYVMVGIMFLMLAMAFIAAGIKFVIRIVSLWLAIITAPLALVAWSFERSKGGGHGGGHGGGYFKRWTTLLLSNAFYPAVFLFILLLISNFMGGQGPASFDQQLLTAASTAQNGVFALGSIIANIGVRLGFVLVMLFFAIKYSDAGTNIWGSDWANRKGADVAFGWTGAALRNTVGWGAARVSGNWKQKDFIISPLANRSYDGRAFPGLKNLPGAKDLFGEATGKGGYKENGGKVRQEKRDRKENEALLRKLTSTGKVDDHDKEHLNHIDAKTLANTPQIEVIAGALSEAVIKKIRDDHDISDTNRNKVIRAWEEAKYKETHKLLGEINKSIQSAAGGQDDIGNILKKNATLNKTSLTTLKNAFEKKADEAKVDRAQYQRELQSAVSNMNAARKAKNKSAEADAQKEIDDAKKKISASDTAIRNLNKGMQTMDKTSSSIG